MKHEQVYLDGWVELYKDDGTSRTQKFSDEAIFNIIQNCGKKEVQAFAQKYGMSRSHVNGIRNGNKAKKHWQYLREHGIIDV